MARRYKCPYCDDKYERKDLIEHIDKKHEDLIPENFTSTRIVFNLINKRECGFCRVCNKETKWREDLGRYDILCENPKCKEELRRRYQENMIRVRGTDNILNDPEQQKKMLANRSISGKYKFTDGGVLTFTGSYEKKCLEFMDKVLEIPSKDILSPGPTLEYEMNGEKHFYITDFYLIPQNLIIEVKDGGDNLNTKDSPGMRSSRERTLAKEKLITESGEYNYIRLTNNNFAQLLDVLMEIKEAQFDKRDGKIIKVNESYIIEADEDILEKIKKFNKELCTYEYIIVKPNGKVVTKIKQDDFKNYNILSPSKFKRYKGGICWDYVAYENANFPNVKHKTFFFCMVDKDYNPKHTHTFLLFYLNDKTYWFESSWKSNMGIFEFDNEDEALSFIINKLSSAQSDKGEYYVVEYKPNNYIGMSEDEFLEAMSKLPEYNYKTVKNPSHNVIQSIKVKNGKIVESCINEGLFNKSKNKIYIDEDFRRKRYNEIIKITKDIVKKYGDGKYVKMSTCNQQYKEKCIKNQDLYLPLFENSIPIELQYEKDGSTHTKLYKETSSAYKKCLQYLYEEIKNKKQEINITEDIFEDQWNACTDKHVGEFCVHYRLCNTNVYVINNESAIIEGIIDNYRFLDIKKDKSEVLKYLKKSNISYAEDIIENYIGEIIVDKDKMIGRIFVGNKKDKGFIVDLEVSKTYRGQKLGNKLIDDAIKKYNGIDLLVDKDNEIALSMYKKRGFVIVKEINNQYYMKLKSKLTKDDKTVNESYINEANFINDKGEKVPKICPKCGSKVGLYFRGEPVYLCSKCNEYFGVPKFSIKEATEEDLDYLNNYIL